MCCRLDGNGAKRAGRCRCLQRHRITGTAAAAASSFVSSCSTVACPNRRLESAAVHSSRVRAVGREESHPFDPGQAIVSRKALSSSAAGVECPRVRDTDPNLRRTCGTRGCPSSSRSAGSAPRFPRRLVARGFSPAIPTSSRSAGLQPRVLRAAKACCAQLKLRATNGVFPQHRRDYHGHCPLLRPCLFHRRTSVCALERTVPGGGSVRRGVSQCSPKVSTMGRGTPIWKPCP